MSEEEIIDIVKKEITNTYAEGKAKALQGLLDLYKELKQDYIDLDKECREEKEKNKLQSELILNMSKRHFNDSSKLKDTISKDKIKGLLEEIRQEKNVATTKILNEDYHLAENGAVCQTLGYVEGKIEELLEGE